jgi:SAM-dependent methyltransferase
METDARLRQYRETWNRKPVLREIYRGYYRRIAAACKPGSVLEIGGGSGNFESDRDFRIIRTDILPAAWLDVVCDAQSLPFDAGSFDNIVMVDVLHHIERPIRFLREADRVLRPGGRLILIEPGITPVSWLFYKLLHPEPVVLGADPLVDGPVNAKRNPYDANQAIPTLLVGRHRERFLRLFPDFRIVAATQFDLVTYPLSGGFRRWSLIPRTALDTLLCLDRVLEKVVGRMSAFRLFVTIEKCPGRTTPGHNGPASGVCV